MQFNVIKIEMQKVENKIEKLVRYEQKQKEIVMLTEKDFRFLNHDDTVKKLLNYYKYCMWKERVARYFCVFYQHFHFINS